MMMHEHLKKISKKLASCSSKSSSFSRHSSDEVWRKRTHIRKDVAGLPRTPSRSVETKHSLSREGEETSLQSSSIAHRIFFSLSLSLSLSLSSLSLLLIIIVLLRSFLEDVDDATTVKASMIEKIPFHLCAITTRTAAGSLPW